MGCVLPMWCRKAKHTMIDKNIGTAEISKELGYTQQYVSSIINGRVYASTAVKKISDYLGIDDDYRVAEE